MRSIIIYYNPQRARTLQLNSMKEQWAIWKRSIFERIPHEGKARIVVADLRGIQDKSLMKLPLAWHLGTPTVALIEVGVDVSMFYELGYSKVFVLGFDDPVPIQRVIETINEIEQSPREQLLKRVKTMDGSTTGFVFVDPSNSKVLRNPFEKGDRVVILQGKHGHGLSTYGETICTRYLEGRPFYKTNFISDISQILEGEQGVSIYQGCAVYIPMDRCPLDFKNLKEVAKQSDVYVILGCPEGSSMIETIQVPEFHKRRLDFEPLIEKFLETWNQGKTSRCEGVSPQAMSLLTSYNWPGGIKEFKDTLLRAFLLSDFKVNPILDAKRIRGLIYQRGLQVVDGETGSEEVTKLPNKIVESMEIVTHAQFKEKKRELIEQFEKSFLVQQLTRTGGNVSEVARTMGMDRSNLLRLMRRHRVAANPFRKAA